MTNVKEFKAYDVRGKVPSELNDEIAYKVGRAFAQFLKPKKVVVGFDARLSSESLAKNVREGLIDGGVDEVVDISLCGTEMVYFATSHLKADGGIMITASHNPKEYNGMKFVREESRPISGDTGLNDIRDLVANTEYTKSNNDSLYAQKSKRYDIYPEYAKHILGYIDTKALKKIKIVANAGNGVGGKMVEAIKQYLPFEFVEVHFNPDGTFPNGIPNPLLVENRDETAKAVVDNKADIGVAWDGDADRCFLFDSEGKFIEGYYIVGLLAQVFLQKFPGSKIIHDPRLIYNTIDIVKSLGGTPVMSKTGHAFIKERMRKEDAIYGGEMSAHHYFRDFSYCDSGMLPWLLIAELLCTSGKSLAQFVKDAEAKYPISGEINSEVADANAAVQCVYEAYKDKAEGEDRTDGISLSFGNWRFNLRCSNTEPVVRLNVESKGDKALVDEKTKEILAILRK